MMPLKVVQEEQKESMLKTAQWKLEKLQKVNTTTDMSFSSAAAAIASHLQWKTGESGNI